MNLSGLSITGLFLTLSVTAQAVDLDSVYLKGGASDAAPACQICHGPDGQGLALAGYPRLAGLPAGYIEKQLSDFVAGTRINPLMQPIAQALTAEEIASVSQALAAQAGPNVERISRAAAAEDLGAKMALRGSWERNIPECVSCHGPSGVGVGQSFPPLLGQSELYLSAQLNAWRNGARKNDPNDLMGHIARKMTDEEVKAVSSYFANLSKGRAL